jgi:hypothetical protein
MDKEQISFTQACAVWWTIFWRSLVLALAGGFGVGFVISIFGAASGADPAKMQMLNTWVGFVVGILCSVWAVKTVLTKRYFKNFEIVLISRESGK